MKTSVLLAAASALAVCAGSASAAEVPAPSSFGQGTVAHRLILKNNLSVLYSQNDNDGGTGLDSQMFESSLAAYDDQAADDFTVPANRKWIVKEVDVTGVYIVGSGPAASENVFFYANSKNNLPGKLLATYSSVAGTDNGTGSFAIPVPRTVLRGGASGKTYWVSVQANCNYAKSPACGQWGWEDRSVQNGNPAAWRNPGDGFGTGCRRWGTMQNCLTFGPDLMFTLKGKAR